MKTREGQSHVFTDNEYDLMFSSINTNKHLRNKAIISLLFHAGLRVGELINITINDIYRDNKIIDVFVISKNFTKTKESGNIYLSNIQLKKDLLNHINNELNNGKNINDYLFTSVSKHKFNKDSLRNLVRSLLKNNMYTNASSHSGRRTFATNLYDKTNNILFCQKALRHKSITTTQRYCLVNENKLIKEIERI